MDSSTKAVDFPNFSFKFRTSLEFIQHRILPAPFVTIPSIHRQVSIPPAYNFMPSLPVYKSFIFAINAISLLPKIKYENQVASTQAFLLHIAHLWRCLSVESCFLKFPNFTKGGL